MTFGWSASTDNVGVAGYTVFLNGSSLGTTSSTSYPLSSLSCGTSYVLGVSAYDAAGNASTAQTLTSATLACPPPPQTSKPGLVRLLGIIGLVRVAHDARMLGSVLLCRLRVRE